MRATTLVFLFALLTCVTAQEEEKNDEPKPRGERLLGVDVSEAADGDYGKAFHCARGAGMNAVSLSLSWGDVEKEPGKFDNPYPAIANIYFPPQNVLVSLMIGPVDTVQDRRPRDLKGKPWDDPEVVARFKKLVDHVLGEMPDVKLACLAVGNEVDGTLRGRKDWEQYTRFFKAIKAHVREKRKDLKVGVKIMFDGLTGDRKDLAKKLNAEADVVLATYYPLNKDFTVKDPKVVQKDWKETFKAWDRHAARVRLVFFTWLHDMDPAGLDDMKKYYGVGDERFLDFLATLGLRHREGSGRDKEGFAALKREAKARGW
ncbi:MAG: hypothetical protein ACYTDY_19950 [Planctomycetota bacterium]|jgi:hypothetical protein